MAAAAMLRSGQVQRSIQLLEQGLAQAPEDPELLALLAQARLANNDLAHAIPLLERAARNDPQSAQVRSRLQIARLLGGQTAAVLADLEAGMAREPASPLSELLYVVTLLQSRQFEHALEALAPLEKRQRTPLVLNLKAAALIGQGKPEAAREALENALALNPRFTTALVNLARLDLREQGPHAARRRLENYLQRDPGNARVLTVLAQMGPELGASNELIIEWLERARAAAPRSVPQLTLLARAYLRSGDAAKAMQAIEQAEQIDPGQHAVLELRGETQMALGQTSAALGTYSALALQFPRSADAQYRLARAQDAAGNTAGATLTLQRALELEPGFAPALTLLGALNLQAGRTEAALATARELKRSHPTLPAGFVLEGDVYRTRQAFDQAAAAYFAAYARGDGSAELAIKLHMALRAAGRGKEAEQFLGRFEKEHPAEVAVQAYLGDVDLSAGRYAAAIQRYARVLEAQPQNALVLNNTAWAAYKLGDGRAQQYAEKAHQLRPDDPVILDTLGWLLLDHGQAKRAIGLLQRAVTLAPDNSQTRYHLAQALLQQGDLGAARRELELLLTGKTAFAQEAEARALQEKLR
jgi:putative PEP-CTERM system TPR-repeat lipoprotein